MPAPELGVCMFRLAIILVLALLPALAAQADDLVVGTVTRPPFSMEVNGDETGFSMDLWSETAQLMKRDYTVRRFDSFRDMLSAVQLGQVDLAIANISVTSEREQVMDFSQPIFSSGLQIMTHRQDSVGSDIWRIVTSKELLVPVLIAFGMLFCSGMLMWRFERGKQPYFDDPARKAMFPAFWWALNLVVNGGFEERMPRSVAGRLLGVFLVISSLFIVSIFVARITSMMTVEAISGSVTSINDLYGKRVGSVSGSTAATYLNRRDLSFTGYPDPQEMLTSFEDGQLDAVVFDAPILAYYVTKNGNEAGQLVGSVFLRENYGIALPSGSPLSENINQALLNLREDGSYAQIVEKWFGVNSE